MTSEQLHVLDRRQEIFAGADHPFPLYYERYIEVFGGGGCVAYKLPGNDFEVYNDFNSLLVNLTAVCGKNRRS